MIYFLSDAHLGSKVIDKGWAHQRHVIDMLSHMEKDAQSIYMMGDMFDFWFEYFMKDQSKHEFDPLFKKIRHLIRHGIHVHYFVGNHDLWTYGGIEKICGAFVHTHAETITRFGKSIYLCHGDGVVPSNLNEIYPPEVVKKIHRFEQLRGIFHSPFNQFLFRCLPPSWGNKFGYHWAAKSRMKEITNPCPYKGEDAEELVLYAKEQERIGNHHDIYIFGHRHIELNLQIAPESQVVILGDCFKQWTYARLDNHGHIELFNYDTDHSAESII